MIERLDTRSDSQLATLLWGLVGALSCASMIPLEPNMLEEGLILEIAQRLARGQHLYQDVVIFTGPLPFEFLAWLFRLFGEELLIGRVVVAILHGGATATIHAIARSVGPDGRDHVAAGLMACAPILLFPLFSTYFYTTLAVSIGVLASGAALAGLRDFRWAIVAGVLVAAAALCKQTVGFVLAIGLLTSVGACAPRGERRRAILGVMIGGGAVTIVTLAAFAFVGGLGALVHSLVELPMSFEPSYNSPFMNFWPPGRFSEEITDSQVFYLPYLYGLLYGGWGLQPGVGISLLTQLLFALPLLAIGATALRRWQGPLAPAVWIHFATLIAMTSNLFPRSDWGHLVSVLPSAAIHLALLLPRATTQPEGVRRAGPVCVGLLAISSAAFAVWLYSASVAPNFGPRVPLRPVNPGYQDDAVPRAIRFIREHTEPGDPIFVARAEPLIYFATETLNPTPYGGVIPGMQEEQQETILRALESTRYVVMSDIDQPVFTYYRDELPRVQDELERRFHIPDGYLRAESNWMLVLERGSDRGATHTDLIDENSTGTRWMRTANGRNRPAPAFEEPIPTVQNRRFLPVVIGPRGGGIDFSLEIPENGVFQASIGYPVIATGAKSVHRHPRASQMSLSIWSDEASEPAMEDRGQGGWETLSEWMVRITDEDVPRWQHVEADLAAFAGRSVRLRLEAKPERARRGARLAWWGSPRIAIRPSETDR